MSSQARDRPVRGAVVVAIEVACSDKSIVVAQKSVL